MKDRIQRYITEHNLLVPKQKVTVALSGGADSVCLLLALKQLGYNVRAAHCNFHLRGNESERDMQFCVSLCKHHNIVLDIKHFDTKAYAESHGISIEMAARDLRYEWFETFGTPVAVGHHRDDQAETLLLNIVRGTGLKGMQGMAPKRDYIIRPLLCVTRSGILEWLKENGETFVTDSSNLHDDVKRNVLRLSIIPQLSELNPQITETLADTCNRMREAYALYQEALESSISKVFIDMTINLASLMKTTAPETILHEILTRYGYTSDQAHCIFAECMGEPGAVYESDTHILLRDRGVLILRSKNEEYVLRNTVLPLEGRVCVADDCTLEITRHQATDYDIPRSPDSLSMDLDKVQFPLTVRLIEAGDRFAPFGMHGTQLVSDFLTNQHVNLFEKQRQLLLVSGTEIAWVVGRRPSARFAIDENTKRVLKITFLH